MKSDLFNISVNIKTNNLSWVSSVSIGDRMDEWGLESRHGLRTFLQNVQTGSVVQPASSVLCTEVLAQRQSGWSVKVTIISI